ncbi:MAG: ASKHA domain-containing protein [Desulfobacteraceae bacterium]|nr:ASKHA domain-containing protein [Desulfobacteraceae bacterium]
MSRHTIRFLPYDTKIRVESGERLLRAAMEAGVHINASCGGEGVCGKCRVIVESGEVEDGFSDRLSPEDVQKGYRLACRARVRGDVDIRVPIESEIDAGVLNRMVSPRKTARIQQADLEELKEQGLFLPPVEKHYLELPEPTPEDNLADVTRLVNYLKIHHGEHRLVVDLPVIRKTPVALREDHFRITATLARPVQENRKTRVINIQPGDTTDKNFAVAVDIGTTTIYGQLIDLKNGHVLAEAGEFNAQLSYGEDVITRIVFAEKPGGLEKMEALAVGTVNKVLSRIFKQSGADPDMVSTVTLAGNTTMTQLMLRIEPRHLRRSPYVPASTLYPPLRAVDLGLELGDHVTALFYPAISSYVGGDIVAGVMGSGLYRTPKLTLFMDIGTNAEIVIGNRDWLACAACSAGPAFEGGGITFGMRAAKGAVEDFSIDRVTFEPMVLTIGDVRPRGICGSGLLTAVAELFEAGVIDSKGKFNRDLETKRIRERDGVWEYVLAWEDQTQIDRDLVLTEIDIENLIRAKGAVYAGCQTLLSEVGLQFADIEQIILAGGFGSYVNLEKAMAIGLLPEMDPDAIVFVGNGSLLGAKMSSLTNRIRRDVVEVTRKMTNFELSETNSYMDHYIAALFLPHTDLDRFPKVKERMRR